MVDEVRADARRAAVLVAREVARGWRGRPGEVPRRPNVWEDPRWARWTADRWADLLDWVGCVTLWEADRLADLWDREFRRVWPRVARAAVRARGSRMPGVA